MFTQIKKKTSLRFFLPITIFSLKSFLEYNQYLDEILKITALFSLIFDSYPPELGGVSTQLFNLRG